MQHLGFTRLGDPHGKPLAIVHGWGCDSSFLLPVADMFRDRDVFLIDLPGYGKSMHLAPFARDLVSTTFLLINTLPDGADVIAWSFGTLYVLHALSMISSPFFKEREQLLHDIVLQKPLTTCPPLQATKLLNAIHFASDLKVKAAQQSFAQESVQESLMIAQAMHRALHSSVETRKILLSQLYDEDESTNANLKDLCGRTLADLHPESSCFPDNLASSYTPEWVEFITRTDPLGETKPEHYKAASDNEKVDLQQPNLQTAPQCLNQSSSSNLCSSQRSGQNACQSASQTTSSNGKYTPVFDLKNPSDIERLKASLPRFMRKYAFNSSSVTGSHSRSNFNGSNRANRVNGSYNSENTITSQSYTLSRDNVWHTTNGKGITHIDGDPNTGNFNKVDVGYPTHGKVKSTQDSNQNKSTLSESAQDYPTTANLAASLAAATISTNTGSNLDSSSRSSSGSSLDSDLNSGLSSDSNLEQAKSNQLSLSSSMSYGLLDQVRIPTIRSLVTICGSPRFPSDPTWPGINPVRILKLNTELNSRRLKTVLHLFYRMQFAVTNPKVDKYLNHFLTHHPLVSDAVLMSGIHQVSYMDERPALKHLRIPSLHLFGAKDRLVPYKVVDHIPNDALHRCYIFPYSSHNPFLTEPEEFEKQIRLFFDKLNNL